MTQDGKYVILFVTDENDDNQVYFTDLEKHGKITGKLPLTPVLNELEATFEVGEKFGFPSLR